MILEDTIDNLERVIRSAEWKSLACDLIKTCSAENCNRPTVARGLCRSHWAKWRRRQPDRADFLRKQRERNNKSPHRHIGHRYGLSREAYDTLYLQQGGRCAICREPVLSLFDPQRPPRKQVARVDHCHVTGKVRGLLCNSCNVGLGHLHDSKELLERAITYLTDFDATL